MVEFGGHARAGPLLLPDPQPKVLERTMSVLLPFLAVLFAGAVVAYHRWPLASWVGLAAALLVGCWIGGASHVAVLIAAMLLALVATPLLMPAFRKPYIT